MKRRCMQVVSLGVFVVLALGAAPTAHAYIDPGSTNYIIQIILGTIFGAGVAITTFWSRLRRFFSRGSSEEDATTPDRPSDDA